MKPSEEFIQLWNELGDTYDQLPEEKRIEKEYRLFDLKKQLTRADVPIILERTDSSRMVRKALLNFLS